MYAGIAHIFKVKFGLILNKVLGINSPVTKMISVEMMDEKGVDPYRDVLTLPQYRELFGYEKHTFTGVDYVEYYGDLVRACGAEVEFVFANDFSVFDFAGHIFLVGTTFQFSKS